MPTQTFSILIKVRFVTARVYGSQQSADELSLGEEVCHRIVVIMPVTLSCSGVMRRNAWPEIRWASSPFLVVFPVLVLLVFAWLVGRHSNKLFAPQDFKNEENYVKLISGTASLTAASLSSEDGPSEDVIGDVVRTVQRSASAVEDSWSRPFSANRVLWVDDRPENNVHERRALEAMGLRFTISLSTADALEQLSQTRFAAIISDMGRKEGEREGYVLLDEVRKADAHTPFFIYAGSKSAAHTREALSRGAQGSTNNAQELFSMVMRAIVSRQTEAADMRHGSAGEVSTH